LARGTILPPGLKFVNSKIKRDHCKNQKVSGDGTGPAPIFGLHCLKKRGPSHRKFPVCLRLLFELSLDQRIYFVCRQPLELARVLKILCKSLHGHPPAAVVRLAGPGQPATYVDNHHHKATINAAATATRTSKAGIQPLTKSRVAGSVAMQLTYSNMPNQATAKIKLVHKGLK
jgi:hypothetical protein